MDRRRFIAAGIACGASFPLIRPTLRLFIRGSDGEFRFGDPYQEELRATVAKLQAHRHIEAFTWGTDYAPLRDCLTGTCDVAAHRFPPAFAPILGGWLAAGQGRRVCAALGSVTVNAFTMADARRMAGLLG